jgi:hypothetical protein
MMFERDIPIPPPGRRGGGSKPRAVWGRLAVGDSVWVEGDPIKIANAVRKWKQRHAEMRFVTRAQAKDGLAGCRVWRTG